MLNPRKILSSNKFSLIETATQRERKTIKKWIKLNYVTVGLVIHFFLNLKLFENKWMPVDDFGIDCCIQKN